MSADRYNGTFEKDIADQLKKVASGELEVAYPFSPKDWRHDALATLLWDAAEEIERLLHLNNRIADTVSNGLEKLQKGNEVLGKILNGELA